MPRAYLDHAATSPLRPAARDAMIAALAVQANASSVHAEGRAARAIVEDAREKVARLVGGVAGNVIFTSGATEALNLALRPQWRLGGGPQPERLLLGAIEHVAALEGHSFGDRAAVVPLPPEQASYGCVNPADFKKIIGDLGNRPVMLCVQAANNETGFIQPLLPETIAEARAFGGLAVCDAVQMARCCPSLLARTDADMLVIASHKIGGPQGVGALVLRDAALRCDAPLIRGGGQERGLRAGTQNVAAIAGFGAAAQELMDRGGSENVAVAKLQERLEAELLRLAPDARIFCPGARRIPITAFAIPGLAAETALIAFDLAGVALSSGSACSSGKVKRSHVLAAMGVPDELSRCALRASLGWNSTEADVAAFATALGDILARIGRKTAV